MRAVNNRPEFHEDFSREEAVPGSSKPRIGSSIWARAVYNA